MEGPTKKPSALPLVIAGLAIVTVVVLERALAEPAPGSPAFLQFLGRFHPLAVHLPIGVLLFVAFVEALRLVPALRPRVEPVLPFLLPFLLVTAVGSFALGLFLAHGGGFPARLVRLHRLFTLGGVIGAAILFGLHFARDLIGEKAARIAYQGVLVATLGAISYGAHHGGSMTRGEGYLFQYAPAFVQKLAGYEPKASKPAGSDAETPKSTDPRVFADAVMPVLSRTCFECHGEATQKGGLRLDSFAAMQKGGDGGPALVSGAPEKSPLLVRMTLPAGNDERMPPENKPAPTAEEIAMVRFWIARGASETLLVRDALAPDDARKALEATLSTIPATTAPAPSADPTSAPSTSADTPPETPPTSETTSGGATPSSGSGTPSSGTSSGSGGSSGDTAFASHVAPILEARCASCHGAAKQKGKLRVDSLDALLAGGKAGPAIIAKSAASSPLVARARLPLESDEHMPPKKEPQLTDREIALVSWWIDAGASNETPSSAIPTKLRGGGGDTPPVATGTATPTSTPPIPTAPPTTTGTPENPPVIAGKDPVGKPPAGQVYVYRDVVAKVVGKKCGSCHAAPGPSGGLDVMTYEGLLASSVVPGKPDESPLLVRSLLPADHDDHMPPPALPQPTPDELALVRTWIQGGAARDALVAYASIPTEIAAAVELPAPENGTDAPPLPSASVTPPTGDDGPPPVHGGGCAGCNVGDGGSSARVIALGAAIGLAWIVRRRRARSRGG